jgi:hypothetical protein
VDGAAFALGYVMGFASAVFLILAVMYWTRR